MDTQNKQDNQNNNSEMSKKICPKCGKELSITAKFCPQCGEELNDTSIVSEDIADSSPTLIISNDTVDSPNDSNTANATDTADTANTTNTTDATDTADTTNTINTENTTKIYKKICPDCSAINVSTAKFCFRCGKNLLEIPIVSIRPKKITLTSESDNSNVDEQPDTSTQSPITPTPDISSGTTTSSSNISFKFSEIINKFKELMKHKQARVACLAILIILIGIFAFTMLPDNTAFYYQAEISEKQENKLESLALKRMGEFLDYAYNGSYDEIREYLPPRLMKYYKNSSHIAQYPGLINKHLMRICSYYTKLLRKDYRSYTTMNPESVSSLDIEPDYVTSCYSKYPQPVDRYYRVNIRITGYDNNTEVSFDEYIPLICIAYKNEIYFDPFSINYMPELEMYSLFDYAAPISFDTKKIDDAEGGEALTYLGKDFLSTIFQFKLEDFYTYMPPKVAEAAAESASKGKGNVLNTAYNICRQGLEKFKNSIVSTATGEPLVLHLMLGPDTSFTIDPGIIDIEYLSDDYKARFKELYTSLGEDGEADVFVNFVYNIRNLKVDGTTQSTTVRVPVYRKNMQWYVSLLDNIYIPDPLNNLSAYIK